MATEKLKDKNTVPDQILEEIIKAGSRTIRSEIYNRCTESGSVVSKFTFIKHT